MILNNIFKYLAFAIILTCGSIQAETVLYGETSEPRSSQFTQGDDIYLYFTAYGLKPHQKNVTMKLDFYNENDKLLRSFPNVHIEVNQAGVGTASFNAGYHFRKLGFYRVYATLSNGTGLPAIGSRPEGYLTYAVMRDPKLKKAYTMEYSHFMSGGQHKKYLSRTWKQDQGSGQWRHLEQNRFGEYSKNPNADKIILRQSLKTLGPVKPGELRDDYGLANMLPGISRKWPRTEEYFTRSSLKDSRVPMLTGKGLEVWRDYCGTLSKNWAKQFSDHPLRLYQILWEQDPKYGISTWDDFKNIYRTAYEAIHKNDPKALVLAMPNNLEANLRAGLWKYFDGISNHSYIAFPVEQNGLVKRCRDTFALIRKYTGKDMPVYGTEFGYCTWGLKEKEPIQMYGMVRGFLIMLGEGWKSNSLFHWTDYRGEQGFGYSYNLDYGKNGNDWLPHKTSPKPALPALDAMINYVEGHVSAGAIEYLGDTAWGYAYQAKDGHVVLALWDYSGHPRKVEIPVGRNEIEVADMMGNLQKYKTDDGILSLTLTEAPQYILNADSKLWGREAVKMITVDRSNMVSVVGSEIVISGKVNARESAVNGTLQIIPDKKLGLAPAAGKISIGANKSAAYSFPFTIPGDAGQGRYPFVLKLNANGKTVASNGTMLEVKSPVNSLSVKPEWENGKYGIGIELEEAAGIPASGRINVRLVGHPDGRASVPFSLKPNEKKVLTHFYDELEVYPLKDIKAELEYIMDSGYRFTADHELNFLFAPYRPAVRIDGDPADWNGIPAIPIDETMLCRNKQFYSGAKDLTGTVRVAWNETCLLFFITADDDVFLQKETGWKTWAYDCVQMAFTKVYRLPESSNAWLDKLTRAHTELDFALTPKGPEAYRTVTFDPQKYPVAQIDLRSCPLAIVKVPLEDGRVRLSYEIAIPWNFLGIGSIRAGDRLGWSININDRDSDDPLIQRDPSAIGAFELKKTAKFGMITLIR